MASPRVVIVGAGFGGLWAALTLARRDVDVTLVDRNNFRNRALVPVNWAWNYVFFRRSARLILPTTVLSPDTLARDVDRNP